MRCLLMSEFFDQGFRILSAKLRSPSRETQIQRPSAVSHFDFAYLCAFASLRETTCCFRTFHAKAQRRKGKPQSKTILGLLGSISAKLASPKKKAIST